MFIDFRIFIFFFLFVIFDNFGGCFFVILGIRGFFLFMYLVVLLVLLVLIEFILCNCLMYVFLFFLGIGFLCGINVFLE